MKEQDHTHSNFIKHALTEPSSKTFFTRVINIWNTLPKLIVTSESLNMFKNRADLHFYEYKFMTDIRIEEAGL